MNIHWRTYLFFLLAIFGDAMVANAQPYGRFNRVTTPGARRSSTTSPASIAGAARTVGGTATSAQADSLHPYSAQAMAQLQGPTTGAPRSSTWQQESKPVVSRPMIAQQPSRTYFPGMRPGLAFTHPVTLTARTMGVPHICVPGRAQLMGGGGHHR
jgi:hypothetical protein